MAASIQGSLDMEMRSCDIICHVTALDQSNAYPKSAHLSDNRGLPHGALWRNFHRKRMQFMLIYANFCK